jgi:hypothetical protein
MYELLGAAISSCNKCAEGDDMWQGGDTVRFRRLRFVNTIRRIEWRPTYKQIFWDLDGTLAGIPNSMITKYYEYNNWPECHRLPQEIYDDSIVCNSGVTIRRVAIDGVTPTQLPFTDIAITSNAGENANMFFLPLDIYGWVVPLVSNHTYQLEWKDAMVSARTFNLRYSRDPYLFEKIAQSKMENIKLQFTPYYWDYSPWNFGVTSGSGYRTSSLNYTSLRNMSSSSYVNGTFDIMLSTVNAKIPPSGASPFYSAVKSILCPPKGCYVVRMNYFIIYFDFNYLNYLK